MTDANRFDTDLRRGDCWTLEVTWTPEGDAIDLTGYTADFSIIWPRQATGTAAPVDAGELTATPDVDPSGVVTVDLTAAKTAGLPAITSDRYQLRVTDDAGCKTTIAVGTLRIEPDLIG